MNGESESISLKRFALYVAIWISFLSVFFFLLGIWILPIPLPYRYLLIALFLLVVSFCMWIVTEESEKTEEPGEST